MTEEEIREELAGLADRQAELTYNRTRKEAYEHMAQLIRGTEIEPADEIAIPIRNIPQPEGGRVETGVVQFGDDWPGIFLRGDNALYWSYVLHQIDGIRGLLQSCAVKEKKE
jgi:hypothetical protein